MAEAEPGLIRVWLSNPFSSPPTPPPGTSAQALWRCSAGSCSSARAPQLPYGLDAYGLLAQGSDVTPSRRIARRTLQLRLTYHSPDLAFDTIILLSFGWAEQPDEGGIMEIWM